ncbi:hypothetical protein, partial [Vibrio sp. SCSIO 43169]|uniref:hypothetical protein n=2 Tax=Vibrionaceae TaxID=641 RepID=UPI00204307CC
TLMRRYEARRINIMSPSIKTILKELFIISFTAVLTAYVTVVWFGYDIESKKSELEIERTLFNNQVKIVSELAEKAGVLHYSAAQYRQYDLLVSEFGLSKAAVEAANAMQATKLTQEQIVTVQSDFIKILFKSKPFISDEIFTSFSMYGIAINEFIHLANPDSHTLKQDYERAGEYYVEGVELIRKKYEVSSEKAS